jgi:hypothetical protein
MTSAARFEWREFQSIGALWRADIRPSLLARDRRSDRYADDAAVRSQGNQCGHRAVWLRVRNSDRGHDLNSWLPGCNALD